MKVKKIGLPNALTVFRMLLVPVFVAAYYKMPEKRQFSAAVFVLASATDWLDGYLARKMNSVTSFGKLFDPLADKLMVLSILFCLAGDGLLAPVKYGYLSRVYISLMLMKEMYMLAGSLRMLKKGIVVEANLWGKAATVLFIIGILLVFPWHENAFFKRMGFSVIPMAVLLSLWAMVGYTVDSVKKSDALKTS